MNKEYSQKNYSVSTFWDKRGERAMLLVNLNRKQFILSIRLYCSKEDYGKATSGRMLTAKQKQVRDKLTSSIMKAETLLSQLNEPTKESFLKFFKSDLNISTPNKADVYSLIKIKIDDLNGEERFGSANNLKDSMKSFQSFRKELYLEDINESFVKGYKEFMLKRKRSLTTIGIYLRNLRAIYNQAINDGLISGTMKPFKNIQLGSKVKSKSVLYPAQLKQLWEYRSESIRDTRAIAFFFFSYLCNGMNFKDVANLKWKNINGDILSFVREKTKNTKQNQSEIRVYLCDEAKKIIAVWGSKKRNADDLIFEFMPKYKSAKHFNDTIIRYKRICNKALSKIGNYLGFDVRIYLGLARHSFATMQKIHTVSATIISEQLGHSSISTTMHYLKSLPDNMLKEMNNHLLSF
ncbi:MAG: site-specific integrase [Bacteroidota bacterium]|nr:site-specific integrase [Bacteroidota bacterium]